MNIKGIRWGYDGGGFACGPVEGNSIVEIVSVDDNGQIVFTNANSNGEGIDLRVSRMALFDLMMYVMNDDVDFNSTLEFMESNELERYGAIWGDDFEGLEDSKYFDVLSIACDALCHYMRTEIEDEVSPEEYISQYIDEYGDITSVPEISFDDDDDEYDD